MVFDPVENYRDFPDRTSIVDFLDSNPSDLQVSFRSVLSPTRDVGRIVSNPPS